MKVKSFDRRNELLEAALDEFIEKSYEEASLNNIIKNAGISKGTFYYHFQDKQALYLALIQKFVEAKMEFLERRLKDYVHNEDLNIFENLRLQARIGLEFVRDYPRYYLMGLMFFREKGNEIHEAAMDMLGVTSEIYFNSLLERAIERDEFGKGISPSFAKKMLMFLLYRWNEIFDIRTSDYDQLLHDFDDLMDFIQYGLGKGEKPDDTIKG